MAGPSAEIHNHQLTRGDGIAMGIVQASGPFVPVFIARLGGSPFEVSLLTSIPAISGFLLAIPIGQFLQGRRRIVPWYARSRMIAHFAYGLAAVAVFFAPSDLVVPVILVIWALAAVPATIGIVSFYVVMDGAAGPRGRYELMSRRWAIMGLTASITVVVVGLLLERIPFPANYQLVFVGFTLAGLMSYYFSSQFRIPQADPPEPRPHASVVDRLGAMIAAVRAQPEFLRFSVSQFIYAAGSQLVLPLIPLYYVRVVDAPDAWIGVIALCQSVAALTGFVLWRRVSARRGSRLVFLVSLAGAAIYPALLALVDQLIVVALLAGFGGIFSAGVMLALFDELMKSIPGRLAVSFASINTVLTNAAGIVAPLVGATLAVVIGIENALRIGSIVSLLGFVLFAFDAQRRSDRTSEDTTAKVTPSPN